MAVLATVTVGGVVGRAPSPQAATPIVRAAFYYPWYPNAWDQQGMDPFSQYTPSAGYYSSSDPTVIRQQIAAMQYGHLDAGIISWWGQGSEEDSVVPSDLAAADGTGFKWSLYYEPEGYGDPSVAQIQSDLTFIKARYATSPNYLTIDGKPVIFVYADPGDGCTMAQRWSQANAGEGFYTVLKVFAGYQSCASDASAWHQYAPSEAEDHQQGYSFSISPGFDKANESAPRLARNLTTWAQNVRDMVASDEPLQLITTFNEWGEGTAVESADQWSSPSGYGSYLDVMHNEIPVPLPTSPGGSGTGGSGSGSGSGGGGDGANTGSGSGSTTTGISSTVASGATWVSSGAKTTNFEAAFPLRASFRAYRTLLEFPTSVPAGSTVISAALTLDPQVTRAGSFEVWPEGPFDPSTVTWKNQPPRSSVLLGSAAAGPAGSPVTIPLTGLARSSTVDLAVTFSTPRVTEKLTDVGAAGAPVLRLTYLGPSAGNQPDASTGGLGSTPPLNPVDPPPTTTTTTSTTTTTTPAVGGATPPTTTAICGTRTGTPTTSKIMVIYEENHSLSAINPSSAPAIASYAAHCGLASDYQSLTHPSLPNYLASTSGVSYASAPWNNDCTPATAGCTTGNNNIFDQVGPSEWKGYAESMTSNCQTSDSGEYVARHNPEVYYNDLGPTCGQDDVPLGTTTGGNLISDIDNGTLPRVSTVTPNLIDDMHDGTIAQGNAWLSTWIPKIVAGPDYRSGDLTVVIVWDEGSGSGNVASTVPAIVLSPFVPAGTVSDVSFTHYSLLKAEEDITGVPELGLADSANSLRAVFGF